MKKWVFLVILLILVSFTGCTFQSNKDIESTSIKTIEPLEKQLIATQGANMINENNMTATQATIETTKGNIVIKLYPQDAPNTVSNFLNKAKNKFYQNLTFHRVEDWVIQGGDPDGNGTGGGSMATELNSIPFKTGSVGIARGGNIKISNDSQFFICTTDCSWLTGQYTNFGEVIEGMEVVKQIQIGDEILSISEQ